MQPKAAANAPKEVGKPVAVPVQASRVRYSPDGKVLAVACFDAKARRYDVTGAEPKELPALGEHNGWLSTLAFGAERLFTADSWGRLSAWDGAKRAWSVEAAHDGWLRALAVTPDKAVVVSCGKDGYVRQWAAASGKRDIEWKLGADLLSLAMGPAGSSCLYVGDLFGTIRELNFASGKPARTLEVKEFYKLDRIQDVGGVKCLALSHDGKTLFAGGAEPKGGGFVECTPLLVAFDLASGKRTSQWKGANPAEGFVTDLAPHADGRVLFTTSGQPGQGKLHVWKPGDAATSFSGGKLPNCHSVALHPNGELAAVSATNANSSGNGRVKGTGGDYPNNASPVQLWTVPRA
jgi:WD40 repeat protein